MLLRRTTYAMPLLALTISPVPADAAAAVEQSAKPLPLGPVYQQPRQPFPLAPAYQQPPQAYEGPQACSAVVFPRSPLCPPEPLSVFRIPFRSLLPWPRF